MKYSINLQKVIKKNIYTLSEKFQGENPSGELIGFTNYYMTLDNKPFYGISAELHYSRVAEHTWRDELIKIKMSGINIISTYVFWIHHEEVEGTFRFDGRRNLRRFVELCKELGLKVIVRIGPFDHGEVRNGGIPDWMYGKPFEVRSLNEGFLYYVERLFDELGRQMEDLYYKDGGPIIAAQMDNEYMHSSAPWEITAGVSNEWVPGGSDGNAYMLKIKELAIKCGIIVPFYTCTGWGGAMAPTDEMLPLWGGYAFWPWIFYSHKGEHPATPEYIYRDFHNKEIPSTYNFDPTYPPESMPYACCEMGGGMMCSYNYRFQLPYESVVAMANIKIASGCNFLGYYMFKGGTNPLGEKTPFLNEGQVNKLSYDYQAALGEFGQIRPSYKQLKALHIFTQSFASELCDTKTVLQDEADKILPEDVSTLRFAVRTKKNSGFVFINNYQDHMALKEKIDESITLQLQDEDIVMEHLSLAKGETAILPFNMNISGCLLKYATAQPITKLSYEDGDYYFFFAPDGMEPVYYFEEEKPIIVESKITSSFTLMKSNRKTVIVTLSREDSLQAYLVNIKQQSTMIITNATLLYEEIDNKSIFRIETEEDDISLVSFPPCEMELHNLLTYSPAKKDILCGFDGKIEIKIMPELELKQVGPSRFTVEIPWEAFEDNKEVLLQVNYTGDIGHAFINGTMISDNFCNGATWEIGLMEHKELLKQFPLCLYITPIKEGTNVNVESTMAARLEKIEKATGCITKLALKPRREMTF